MKNILAGINSRLSDTEERITKLEDRVVEFTATRQKKEKIMKRNENNLRDLWGNIKHTNIHITWVPKREERERKGLRKNLKI